MFEGCLKKGRGIKSVTHSPLPPVYEIILQKNLLFYERWLLLDNKVVVEMITGEILPMCLILKLPG